MKKQKDPVSEAAPGEPGAKELSEKQLEDAVGGATTTSFVLPEVDDEVLVAFDKGDIRKPVVIGSIWSGKTTPPD